LSLYVSVPSFFFPYTAALSGSVTASLKGSAGIDG
jgi:hypothetical protein